jgi:lipid-A-disaccharide synthase
MLEVSSRFKNYQFIIAGAPSQPESFYKQSIKNSEAHFISNDTYNLLNNAHAALVTSGTATLETALFKVPQVVCYKGSWISYEIGKRIVDLKFISLVNLIMDKEVVMELIQNKFNTNSLTDALRGILNPNHRTKILENYEVLEKSLGGIGASENTAKLIVSHIEKND